MGLRNFFQAAGIVGVCACVAVASSSRQVERGSVLSGASGTSGAFSASDDRSKAQTYLVATPMTVQVATIGSEIGSSTITDLAIADFDGDGRPNLAVTWFATDSQNPDNNVRMLSIYLGSGAAEFTHAVDLDLYIPNDIIPALSVFLNGPADIGVGDFDGDGDPDLAVTCFFGDELWLIENLGGGAFEQYLKFPFGSNGNARFQTPPEVLAADFDGDGRDELVYIADPISYIQFDIIHFWKTDGSIADMERIDWEGTPGAATVRWTRGLAVADFDDDGRPDLCFTAASDPNETDPVLVFWHDLDEFTGEFAVHVEHPSFICSDVVAVENNPDCPPGVVLTDIDGTRMEYWASTCDGTLGFYPAGGVDDYAGYSPSRGVAAVADDIDGDGFDDLVTRQRLGSLDAHRQVEVTLSGVDGQSWVRVAPCPLDTTGFQDQALSEILRPRAIAVADLFGNTLPEVVAGFEPAPPPDGEPGDDAVLRVAYWANGCLGDVTRDGATNVDDISALLAALGDCSTGCNEDADLNKDGVVDFVDLSIVLDDYGCACCDNGVIDPYPSE